MKRIAYLIKFKLKLNLAYEWFEAMLEVRLGDSPGDWVTGWLDNG